VSAKVDIRNLDFNNSGSWPLQIKIAACVLLGLLIVGATWYFFVGDQRLLLESKELEEQKLREDFQGKQGRAANLEPLKQQLAQMEVMLQQMLRQLPSKNEMPDLIVDVSQTALASGISNELFQPGNETQLEFYAEKPITLRMVGTYHQFGAFVSGVASLPRVVIMTMHDISLKPRDSDENTLVLEGTVKTYRYLDEEEEVAAAVAPAPAAPAPAPAPGGGK
jgi:type IV pilus assembly protein PilO